MDLIIILDASSSRESVFEHQRELALSLIERLPISKDDTHVAVGVNSFTNTPTLRQHLGLGRDKQMVRYAIEQIEYKGGSTLTSKAVELAIEDLERGKRPDAKQVVVLMNDGMSQDPWDKVVSASRQLAATGAERFGVALGRDIDLREINLYIQPKERIYRDEETERFLSDVVSLLTKGSKDCEMTEKTDIEEPGFSFSEDACQKPKLDLVILFDNSDNTPQLNDPRIVQDRYLLLDVLGSLPTGDNVKVAVYSFTENPKLEHRFSDPQDRESLFERIESIQPKHGNPSYAKAVHQGISYYNQNRRPDARGVLLIAGNGKSTDASEDRSLASNTIRKTNGLTCFAVDTSKEVDVQTLSAFTGSIVRVYNYDRNADFARQLMALADAGKSEKCGQIEKQEELSPTEATAQTYSTSSPLKKQRDIAAISAESKENFIRIDKVISHSPKASNHLDITKLGPSIGIGTTKSAKKLLSTTKLTRLFTTRSTSNPTPFRFFLRQTTKNVKNNRLTATTPISTTLKSNVQQNLIVTRSTRSINSAVQTTKTPIPSIKHIKTTTTNQKERFDSGCLLDVIIIIDSSGSVEETFKTEKELAKNIINKLRIGPNNAKVGLIKFASKNKVRTVHSFSMPQSKESILDALDKLYVSSGITAIHSALQQAEIEYKNNGRRGSAEPIVIIFTDGFSSNEIINEASSLRKQIPQVYAVAINHQYPISRIGLEKITGDAKRVFTDSTINEFHSILKNSFRTC